MNITHRGLAELPGELDKAAADLRDGAVRLEVELADDVVRGARMRAERDQLTGASAGSIRSQGPIVSAGAGVPWYGFADFGGSAGAGRRIRRPYVRGGRWLFPACREIKVGQRAERTLDRALGSLK